MARHPLRVGKINLSRFNTMTNKNILALSLVFVLAGCGAGATMVGAIVAVEE